MSIIQQILESQGLSNHDLVQLLPQKLSHKTVQKARTAKRPLSLKMQENFTEALNLALKSKKSYTREELFPKI
ncbi:MAG: hypothetical protein GX116_03905 [Fibrobacter sp.]|nr:hypothetical protein [Fibrobacter sp.]